MENTVGLFHSRPAPRHLYTSSLSLRISWISRACQSERSAPHTTSPCMSHLARSIIIALILLTWPYLPGSVGPSDASCDEVVLVPFGSTAKFAIFSGRYWDVPEEVYAIDYDDSSWPIGTFPMGDGDDVLCPLDVLAEWPMGTSIVVRVWVDVPPGSTKLRVLRKMVSFSYLWINGRAFGSCSTGGSPCPWDYCDQTLISGPFGGPTLVVITQDSYPWNVSWTYIDFQISVDVPEVTTREHTWGAIKALYK